MKPFDLIFSLSARLPGASLILIALLTTVQPSPIQAEAFETIGSQFQPSIQPILDRYCFDCHSGEDAEAEIDLSAITTFKAVRANTDLWLKIEHMLSTQQMPPRKSDQLNDEEQGRLSHWVEAYLTAEAAALAGDPGPVVLRRLNNSEYTYTVRDLTGVPSLDPTAEFPIDGAAGEGFINTGDALSVSPSLIQKYLDAGKVIANHAVLHPLGIRFSDKTTRRDWTDDLLAEIRSFYARYTSQGGGMNVNLQGIQFDTNQGGVLPIKDYLSTLWRERQALRDGSTSLTAIAGSSQLNQKYLSTLWETLQGKSRSGGPSILVDRIRERFQSTTSPDPVIEEIQGWQQPLWVLNSIGHIGREGGPEGWLVSADPLQSEASFELDLSKPIGERPFLDVYLTAHSAGDGHQEDQVVWDELLLRGESLPDLPLSQVESAWQKITELQRAFRSRIGEYLAAAGGFQSGGDPTLLARNHQLDRATFERFLAYLDYRAPDSEPLGGHFTQKILSGGDYSFVQGWGSHSTPSIMSNASDQDVRIPGRAKPKSVFVHPSPTEYSAVAWTSPIDGMIKVTGLIEDAHPECGNGVEWYLTRRMGKKDQVLGKGVIGTRGVERPVIPTTRIRRGDSVILFIGPRGGNHGCDLTTVDLNIETLAEPLRHWNLADDVAETILEANPHADQQGHSKVWHFLKGNMKTVLEGASAFLSPPEDSFIDHWRNSSGPESRKRLQAEIIDLASNPLSSSVQPQNVEMLSHFDKLAVPLSLADSFDSLATDPRFTAAGNPGESATQLLMQAPETVSIRIPAELAKGRKLHARGRLRDSSTLGSVQLAVTTDPPPSETLDPGRPILVAPDSIAEAHWKRALDDFRELFPPVLCYTKIVPVDEVVTLTLFYREDDLLKRLMLSEDEEAELDRLWEELLFVAREPLELVTAYEQLTEFATQDRPDLVEAWKPAKKPIHDRADAFRQTLVTTEPIHLQAALDFAANAWRRPTTDDEEDQLRDLYQRFRTEELGHEASIRLLIARILTSPRFLYRSEEPAPGSETLPVHPHELATRLSYFLWGSQPDAELRALAAANALLDERTLKRQLHRMLRDPRAKRLAIEFASQWFHLRDFDQNDQKNESLFPEFAMLRDAMYQEVLNLCAHIFQDNRSILDLINAEYRFLNEPLAKHYGIQNIPGSTFQKVAIPRTEGRGGILATAAFLASQSGASRTSPILRGNWISETLLGEKLPRPPLDVPVLPEQVPSGLTTRELIEQHRTNPSCAKCHDRIDPYGLALERFDPIGRVRAEPVDTRTTLVDGTEIEGLVGLQDYLVTQRRDDFVAQFCRKLLGYSLGRSIRLSDRPFLTQMANQLADNRYRFYVAVEAIVLSPQFRTIRWQSHSDHAGNQVPATRRTTFGNTQRIKPGDFVKK